MLDLTKMRYMRTLLEKSLCREVLYESAPWGNRPVATRAAAGNGGGQSPRRGVSISSGCAGLDELLPGKRFQPGQLVEWVADGWGSGAGTLALMVARQACCVTGGALVVADRAGHFYPPAALAWGIDCRRLIVVRASREKDELWALDQCLRCGGVAAVWAGVERLEGARFVLAVGGREWGGVGSVGASARCTGSAQLV